MGKFGANLCLYCKPGAIGADDRGKRGRQVAQTRHVIHIGRARPQNLHPRPLLERLEPSRDFWLTSRELSAQLKAAPLGSVLASQGLYNVF